MYKLNCMYVCVHACVQTCVHVCVRGGPKYCSECALTTAALEGSCPKGFRIQCWKS